MPTAGSPWCVLADRYVDVGREFGRLLDDLVAARRTDPAGRAGRRAPRRASGRQRSRLTAPATGSRALRIGFRADAIGCRIAHAIDTRQPHPLGSAQPVPASAFGRPGPQTSAGVP